WYRMIQRNYMMSAHRLSDVCHSQLLDSLGSRNVDSRRYPLSACSSATPRLLAAFIKSMNLSALRSCFRLKRPAPIINSVSFCDLRVGYRTDNHRQPGGEFSITEEAGNSGRDSI